MSLSQSTSSCHVPASNCKNNMQGQSSTTTRKYVHTVHSVNTHLAACTPRSVTLCCVFHLKYEYDFLQTVRELRTLLSSSNTGSKALFVY